MTLVKLAVLSDVHGNLAALEAVADDIARWEPDRTLVDGDVVNGNPLNLECWQFVRERHREHGWHLLRGNHEEYVVEWLDAEMPDSTAGFELRRLSFHTFRQLAPHVHELAALPKRFDWRAPDHSTLLVLHATLEGSRLGIYPWTPLAEMQQRIAPHPDVFVTAHTHVPFVRRLGRTLLVNVGAVGLPGDGDRRASYGRLTWSPARGWHAALRRVPYDFAAAESAYFTGDYLGQAGPGALLTLVELRSARDAKTRWARKYHAAILAGEISVADSVYEFLAAPEFMPHLPEFVTNGRLITAF